MSTATEKSLAEAPPKKSGKSWLSKTIAWIHLWPSLISAVILIFVCITGTIVVYGDEIMSWAAGDARYVQTVKEERLPVEKLMANLRRAFPDRRNPGYMVVYKDPKRSVRFNMFSKKDGLRMVYVDPYTGKILKDDGTIYFFYVTAHLHDSLLLGRTGQWIVDIATLIFLIELITGLVLWWPAKWTKVTRDASFKVKWKAKFKRLNYDLHNVVGFYALTICLVLTVTGLIIAFKPWAAFTIRAFGGDASHAWEEKLTKFVPDQHVADMNQTIAQLFTQHPTATEAQVGTFELDSSGFYSIRLANMVGLKSVDNARVFFIDRYTGKALDAPEAALKHETIENMYWSLHMGTWLGPIGKLCTFIGGLVSTSLPITGFLIWWGRRKKKPKKSTIKNETLHVVKKKPVAYRPKYVANQKS